MRALISAALAVSLFLGFTALQANQIEEKSS